MPQQITYVVFVNSVRSKPGSKRAPQVVPDNSTGNSFAKGDLRTRARFFETPPQRVVVHLLKKVRRIISALAYVSPFSLTFTTGSSQQCISHGVWFGILPGCVVV